MEPTPQKYPVSNADFWRSAPQANGAHGSIFASALQSALGKRFFRCCPGEL